MSNDSGQSSGAAGRTETAPTLEDLVVRIAAGDDRSFGSFYDQLAGRVQGIARSVLRDATQAEEVAQEVFLELWRTAPRYRPDQGSVATWAMSLAHHRAVDRVRHAEASGRRERRATFEGSSARPYDQVSEGVLEVEEQEQVLRCLQRLTALQRESVHLAYYRGRTYRQIAEDGQVSANTVKSRLRSALRGLRNCLEATVDGSAD